MILYMKIISFIFVFASLIGVFSTVHANEKLSDLPDIVALDINTFVSQSTVVEKIFADDTELNFKVQIPASFRERDASTLKTHIKDGTLYGDVYRADGAVVQDVYPYFQVQSIELQRAISAKNWLISNILQRGETLRAIESDDRGDWFEALYVRLDRLGNTEIIRSKGRLHGKRLVIAEYAIPILLWDTIERDVQTYVIKSFELLTKEARGTPEAMRSYSFLDSFSMMYPASWRITKENSDLENQIDLSFESAEETNVIFANINLSLISDQSLRDRLDRSRYPVDMPKLVQAQKDKVQRSGFLIDPVIERKEYKLAFNHELQITEVYPLHRKLSDYVTHRKAPITHEFWITAIKGSPDVGKNYVLSMVAPARNVSMHEWALAAKAYELIIESLR